MRRLIIAVGAIVLMGAIASGPASSASLTGATGSAADPPWIPYEQQDFTYAAGEGCDFEVAGTVLQDQEFFRNTTTYADGTTRTQHWKGPLNLRLTNTETGASVDRHAWGNAFIRYGPDGSFESITIQQGHFIGRIRDGEPGPGIYYVTGAWSELFRNGDGTSTLILGPNGSAENLCDTLAP